MTADNRHVWAILRIRYTPSALWISYEDGQGKVEVPDPVGANFDWISRATAVPIPWTAEGIKTPVNFDFLVQTTLSSLPLWQIGPHASGPVPLPIFIEPPQAHAAGYPWEAAVENLLEPSIDRDRIQTVRLSKEKSHVRQLPLALPLRVLAIGKNCDTALSTFRSANWYDNQFVQESGLSIETVDVTNTWHTLKAQQHDIVMTDDASVDLVLTETARLSLSSGKRPRLVIFLGRSNHEGYVMNLDTPPGTAFLWLPVIDTMGHPNPGLPELIKEFLYALIHDYPLHEALKAATRVAGSCLERSALLIATPNSNQSLRLSDAMVQLQNEVKAVRPWTRLGDIHQFIARSGYDLTDTLKTQLRSIDESRTTIHRAVESINAARIEFDQESHGLLPLVDSVRTLNLAHEAHSFIQTTATELVSNSTFADQLKRHQERRVDVVLQQMDSDRTYQPVDPEVPLRLSGQYRLKLHIGHRAAESLMVGEPPPVDPLLPDTNDGHNLEVAFFEKDFTLLSKEVQVLYLPRFGGSEPIFFEIRTPKTTRVAEARIGIYYQNNLLQSFLLSANICSADEQAAPLKLKLYLPESQATEAAGARWVEIETDKQVAVHLAFSQTKRFTNLEQLSPRAISIGMNQNHGGDHTFMFKVDGLAEGLNVREKTIDEQITTFRKILKANVRDANKKPLFNSDAVPGDPLSESFKSVVRQLIETGAKLHGALYPRVSKAMHSKLRALAASSDKNIQVIRHDPTSVFPWPIVYDFPLPTKIAGARPPAVCLGFDNTGQPSDKTDPVKKCAHGPNQEGYCIFGFWGLRHEVEQLLELTTDPKDSVRDIVPSAQSFIRLAIGTDDQSTKDLVTTIAAEIGDASTAKPADDLIDVLWDDSTRPGILVVLGHLQMTPVVGEPDEPRIVLEPKKKWFLASSVLNRLKQEEEWDQPNTVVLLMACGSGATEITTLNDFVMNLATAGAAAVIGTECLVFPSLVSRFAREITLGLWNTQSLGKTVKLFNRRLVSAGNPLAFTFNCLGNSDIKLIRA